jgi:hypothetical protein
LIPRGEYASQHKGYISGTVIPPGSYPLKQIQEIAMSNEQTEKKLSQLASRASTDQNFKQKLVNDPAPLLRENGIEIPGGTEPRVVADKESISFEFVPQQSSSAELAESALSAVAGGSASGVIFLRFDFKLVAVK